MGVELPTKSMEFLRRAAAQAVRPPAGLRSWLQEAPALTRRAAARALVPAGRSADAALFAAAALLAGLRLGADPLMLAGGLALTALVAVLARTSSAARRAASARWLALPSAVLVLLAVALDMAVRAPAGPTAMVALAALGLLAALRGAHLTAGAREARAARRQEAFTEALVDVTHALADANDLQATLQVICESARSSLGARGAGVELVLEDGRTLEVAAAVGLPADIVGMRFPVAGSFTGWAVQDGEPRTTLDPSRDPRIQPRSMRFLGKAPLAAAPIRFRGQTTGALFACQRREGFDADALVILGALAEQAAIAIERARLFDQISALSAMDPLTGIPNRRSLEEYLEREFAAARRGRPLVAVIFDLDDFKVYNDQYGHLAGDEALRAFARSLERETRTMNFAARYGGDEFVVLLSDTDLPGAAVFVERVRIRFAMAARGLGRDQIAVSSGMAAFHPAMDGPQSLLRAADNALYRQKPRARV